ncbi:hypothetical protein AVEN_266291-1 [Araneus ventricosus]|uniref:Uncharacterized protein n=1 Tax=Araneus ventricosus TaxID=182803 RepID=A0A4Y2EEX7_ARAVE|nr:hypothetical protein AVEN_266291-1 [Araneus ventricosus]
MAFALTAAPLRHVELGKPTPFRKSQILVITAGGPLLCLARSTLSKHQRGESALCAELVVCFCVPPLQFRYAVTQPLKACVDMDRMVCFPF